MKYCCQAGGFGSSPMYQNGGYYSGPRFQRGGAIRGFAGPEYQMGGKWAFGQFLWRHAKPLLSYLGKQALSTGVDIGQDVIGGKKFKDATKDRLSETGKNVAITAMDRLKTKIQAGKGRRLKKRRKKKFSSVVGATANKTARRRRKRPTKSTTLKRTKSRRKTKAPKRRAKRRRVKRRAPNHSIFSE